MLAYVQVEGGTHGKDFSNSGAFVTAHRPMLETAYKRVAEALQLPSADFL